MSLGREVTKSHQQSSARDQDSSGQLQEIRHISEISIRNPDIPPCQATLDVDMHVTSNKDENSKLLNINSRELQNNGDSLISNQDALGTNYALRRNHIFRSWWQEIAWCVFAAGLLVLLVVLLKTHDKKPAPEWFVSLNAVVAAISTICRASMVIPVSEGLSQLKWNAFARSQRPLDDLKTFDQASRGPFGSLLLLSKTRGRLLGVSTVAAIVLISGLATSSLTQATIAFGPQMRRLSENAIANKASSINLNDWQELKEQLMNGAFQAYFISERQRKTLQLNPSCPSSCHWNKFRTIDICDVQRNVTDQLKLQLRDPDNLGDFDETQGVDSGEDQDVEYWSVTLGDSFRVGDMNAYNWVAATESMRAEMAKVYGEMIWIMDNQTLEKFPVTLGSWGGSSAWKIEPMGRASDAMPGKASDRIIGNATLVEDDPWDNIMAWKEDTTTAMSALVRTYKTDEINTIQGYAEIGQPTIIIHWAWLSLLATQILLMVVFVIYVILETAKLDIQVVKGSNIAELKAMGQEDSTSESEYVLAGGITESVDADLVGRLVKSNSGWNLKVNRRAVG
ncbi:Uncharacterized protein LW93_6006 [Fusarium fujikuroi]|nr:Uncharacterized protein LW93_6006 [Fusarium fujikuroi]